jgi:thiol-disulfide isomerase/thioredoxin
MMRVLCVLALVAVSAEAVRFRAKTPDWACDLKAGLAGLKGKNVAHFFASGDAAVDQKDGEAIEKIASFRKDETAKDEAKLLKTAKTETEIAKKEADLSKALGDKAKLEMGKTETYKAALKDAADSNKAVSDGAKAAEKAKDLMGKAKKEAAETKAAVAKWEEDATFLKASAVVEKEQKVTAVNGQSLTGLLNKKEKDVLVVFYAPWCPHCKTFVMHDATGNAEKAPLELFNAELKQAGATKTLEVVKFDTAADQNVPANFEVQYIPAVYMATKDGKFVPFKGDPHSIADLKTFIKTNAPRTAGI